MSDSVNRTVWLLDDDVSMLKSLTRLFQSAGFAVRKFHDPREFVTQLECSNCSVAISDIVMPEMNGLEVQAHLRQHSPSTKIIFLSGHNDPSTRQAVLGGGAFAYLTKPFNGEALLQLVQEALGPAR